MRLFVALELDERAEALLADCQGRLKAVQRQLRWVRPDQIHLTLKFLGEVPEAQVPAICQALESLAVHEPVEFGIAGIGWFGPPSSPRVIWIGVEEPTGRLEALQKACESALADLGFAPERRPFKPHLTLGRVRRGRGGRQISQAVARLEADGVGPLDQRCDQVVLFESRLRPQGPQYVRLHGVVLRGQ